MEQLIQTVRGPTSGIAGREGDMEDKVKWEKSESRLSSVWAIHLSRLSTNMTKILHWLLPAAEVNGASLVTRHLLGTCKCGFGSGGGEINAIMKEQRADRVLLNCCFQAEINMTLDS